MTNDNFLIMPEPNVLLLEAPLYSRFEKDSTKISELRNFRNPLEFYCVECEEQSIFNRFDRTPAQCMAAMPGVVGSSSRSYSLRDEDAVGTFSMEFVCSRNNDHHAIFYFRSDKNSICKFGEFPSKADKFAAGIGKYKKILGREQMSLQLAQELYSQDIGAGSFVYLRRIFENVIVEKIASRKYKNDKTWNLETWKKQCSTMSRKLTDLSGYLPDFINNTELFKILSAGVHELNESTCLENFNIIKNAIIEILDDEIISLEKQERRSDIGKGVSSAHRKISQKRV